MTWNRSVRQTHRWTSIVFAVVVCGIFAAQGLGREPAAWIYFMPLAPLALLLLTGLYLFALPYVTRWRSGRTVGPS